ncbi:OsmC family protein [uncultured Litoreibacter sp.]|uniref:OsmC family protein n=1 Tax=uncultured Litoreibacter sp. TaxID=1392394 RepID=UPI002604CE65|nr:OsmC family protein [uncultured Litoreibacter sp.]
MGIKMKTTVTLSASADCPSHSLSEVSVRDLTQMIDEPNERGGSNKGFTPTDTALSALIGCTNVIGHKCAKKLGVDIGHLKISAQCTFNRLGVTLAEEIDVPFEAIELTVVADGPATQDELDSVAQEVAKYCPLSKLFRQAGTEIKEDWRKAG